MQARILGQDVFIIEEKYDDDVRTRWRAPLLDCFDLRLVEQIVRDGNTVSRFERNSGL